jgi:SAM-dependent methyltransferase
VKPRTPRDAGRRLAPDILLPVALLVVIVVARNLPALLGAHGSVALMVVMVGFIVPAVMLLNFSPRRLRFALGIAACLVAPAAMGLEGTVATARSFFGVYRVRLVDDGGMRFVALMNGTTLHGVRSLMPGEERQPMAYYSRQGPFGRFFASPTTKSARHVAVVGLGTGELGCYAQPGQDWSFYEIDPVVEHIARDSSYFQFLTNCGNWPRVVLGDARITIGDVPDSTYDILVIDAFSSDSIPMHLLTREALALYLRKLAPGGRLLFHVSSRTLNLGPVIGGLAADAGVPARMLLDRPPPGTLAWRRAPALVVAVAGRGGDLGDLDPAEGWKELRQADAPAPWTDQRSDLLQAIRSGF